MTGRIIARCCWVLLCLTVQAQAAPKILGTDISFDLYTDEKDILTLEDIAALPEAVFRSQFQLAEELQLPAGSHWLRLQLTNEQLPPGSGWIEIQPGPLDKVTLYERSSPVAAWESTPRTRPIGIRSHFTSNSYHAPL